MSPCRRSTTRVLGPGPVGPTAGRGVRRADGWARAVRPAGSVEHVGGRRRDWPWPWPTGGRRGSPSSTSSAAGRSAPSSWSVDRRVLIPRPETEQVVEVALAELASLIGGWYRWPGPGLGSRTARCAVDLGTGSGAIALSLAVEGGALAPDLVVWATDSSRRRPRCGRRQPRRAGSPGPEPPRTGSDWSKGWWFERPSGRPGREGRPAGLQSSLRRRGRLPRPRSHGARVGAPGALVAPDARRCRRDGRHRDDHGRRVPVVAPDRGAWSSRSTRPRPRRHSTPPAGPGWTRCGTRRDLAGRVRMVVARR